jgi:CHAT domain-containing protein
MRSEGDLDKAEEYHRRALEIRRRVEPRHRDIASSLYAMGMVERERGRPDAAEMLWREAVSIIERSRREIGASDEVRSRYGARYSMLYHQLARLLAEQDREAEAWDLLEEVRARALRTTIAGRESIPEGVPSELWFAKTRSENSIGRIEGRLARMDPVEDEASIHRYRERLNAAQQELDTIVAAIREAAPRFASFSTPEAVTLDETVQALDAGTAVISYSFGEDEGMALVLAPSDDPADRLHAFHIPLGAKELSTRVNILHALIARGKTVGQIEDAYISQARRLFQLLVEPAMDTVSAAERILIIPDGPLVDIPFGALVVPGPETRFFGHWKALFFNPSVSVHVQLGTSEQRSLEGATTVVAFGDADYTPGTPLVDRYRLQPLPGTRTEIRSIESVFGSRASSYLGSAATEASFRMDGGRADVVHCAVHAVTDDRFPMDSALLFTHPGGAGQRTDDGVLWAWEIADELEIGARVVVLSACSTGRGQVVAGEGVFGLARAFQYAGAKTLVASQWEIPDESTARLMGRFYTGLNQGLSTVDALRLAQRETSMNDSGMAHPYHWASFQVRGDWR